MCVHHTTFASRGSERSLGDVRPDKGEAQQVPGVQQERLGVSETCSNSLILYQYRAESNQRHRLGDPHHCQVGSGHIWVEDLILIGLHYVGQDTWQPHIRLIRPRV